MNIRLMCAAVVVLIGTNLDAGYFCTSRMAEAIVPASIFTMGIAKGVDQWVIATGLAGVSLVLFRNMLDTHGIQDSLVEYGTKAAQVALPLGFAYYLTTIATQKDAEYKNHKRDVKANCTKLNPAIENGFPERCASKLFLGIAAVEAAIQICC